MGLSPKKLCILIPGHWTDVMGGSQYQVKCLLDILIPTNNYEIFFVTKNFDEGYQPKGYQIKQIDSSLSIKLRGALFVDTLSLLEILNTIRPDIIYQRVGCAYTGIASFYANRNDCKMVWHISSDMDATPFKFSLKRDIPLRYIDKKFLEYGICHSNFIIAQTAHQDSLLKQHYNRSVTAVVPNFHPFPTDQTNKSYPIKVVWVSNLKPLKQPELFVRLARDLQYLKDVQFLMIGTLQGSQRWQNRIIRDINQLYNLTFFYGRTQEEVNKMLASAHILINTSLWEGFANTFIQAWMREVPVVSLNVNPDGIFDDQDIGFHSRTYETLTDDVLRLIKNHDLRQQMGAKAQTYAFSMHSQKNVEKIIEIFDGY